MEQYTPIYIFLFFILILIFNYIAGTKVGLVNKILSVGTIFISIYISKIFGPTFSKFINTNWLNNILNKNIQNIPDLVENTDKTISTFPFSIDSITSGITSIAQDNISKISLFLITLFSYAIVFVLSMIIIKIIGKILVMVDYVPILGTINRIGGGVFGIFEVLLITEIILFVLKLLSAFPVILNFISYIEVTPIINTLYSNNFINGIFSSMF